MEKGKNLWTQVRWRCTTCGLLVSGCVNRNKQVRIECSRCHTVMIRTSYSRRHSAMEIYEPTDGWNSVSMRCDHT